MNATIVAQVPLARRTTIYGRAGDLFAVLSLAGAISAIAFALLSARGYLWSGSRRSDSRNAVARVEESQL